MNTTSPLDSNTSSIVVRGNHTDTHAGDDDNGELTLRQGLQFLVHALRQLAHMRPEALVLVVFIVLTASFLITGLPAIIVACHQRRKRAQAHDYERTLDQPLDDMHVALDSDTEADDSSAPSSPPPSTNSPSRPQQSFTLPRVDVSKLVAQFPTPPRDMDDLHMTPRTRATILGKWTPRKDIVNQQ